MDRDREAIDMETARFREREAREQESIRREEAILKERVDREFAPIRREEERIRLMNEKLKADKAAFKAKYNTKNKNINEF
jgi:hypothetical protein